MDARIRGGRGGAEQESALATPLLKKNYFILLFICMVAYVLLVLHVGAFLQRFSPFSSCAGTFLLLFLHVGGLLSLWGAFFMFAPSPPTKISVGTHEYRYSIAAH